ncbi:MAG: transposase [SAR324 cluster bacterium]|nr:transposase [SAR324 cluster bacterium]
MITPDTCEKCYKFHNQTIIKDCQICYKLRFDEEILCDLTRYSQDNSPFECHAFRQKLALVQKDDKEDTKSIEQIDSHKSPKDKWREIYSVQQLKMKPDEIHFNLKYHVSFNTIKRRPLFSNQHFTFVSKIIEGIGSDFKQTQVALLWLAVDHLHLYIDSSPDYSIEELTISIMNKSEMDIISQHSEFQEKQIIWEREYFAETLG